MFIVAGRRVRFAAFARPEPGGFGLGSLGPVSEGLFIWTLGLMIIIGFTVWLTTRSA